MYTYVFYQSEKIKEWQNYNIGFIGGKYPGLFNDRNDGEWEGFNKPGLVPESLYEAQVKDREKKQEHSAK